MERCSFSEEAAARPVGEVHLQVIASLLFDPQALLHNFLFAPSAAPNLGFEIRQEFIIRPTRGLGLFEKTLQGVVDIV